MPFWLVLLLFTVSTVLGQLFRPKVAPPKPASFSEFDFPTADPNRAIPRPYGTVLMKAPNVTSVTDFSTGPLTIKVPNPITFGFTKKKQTIGFKYYCGIEMALGYRVDRFTQINIGDKVAWTGSVTTDSEVFINQPTLFGGDDQTSGGNGGIVGYVGFHVGLPNASKDAYLVSEYGNYSAHRDRSYVVFKGQHRAAGSGYLGNSTTVAPWAFVTETLPSNIAGAGAYHNINSGDANPAEVIYDVMRNALYGAGMDSTLIDTAAFLSAAQTYFNDGIGFSGLWDTSKPCSDVINSILTLTDSILYSDLRTGLCVLKAARADYDPATLQVFDESNILSMAGFSRSAWDDTTNWLTVPYIDRADSFSGKTALAYNLANVETQGGRVASNVQHVGISNKNTAAKIAQRDLRALSTPLAKHTIQVNRTAYKMTPGAVYKWNWPDIVDDQGNSIQDMVMRATSVKYGDTDQPIIEIEGIEDVFNSTANVLAAPPASSQPSVTTPAADSATIQLSELPYMFSGQDAPSLWTMAVRPAGNYTYDLFDSPDNSEFSTDQSNNSFTPTGVLNGSYAQNTNAIDNSGTFVVTGSGSTDLDRLINATSTQIGNGANLMLVVQSGVFEIMAFETISIVSGNYQFNNVWRGLLDTTPQAFTAGARVWFFSYGDARGGFTFAPGSTAYAKLLSRSLQGTLDAGSATLVSRTINQRAIRPYAPGNVTINASATTTTIPSTGDITVAWAHRDRTRQGTVIPQSNTSIAGPEGGTSYILKIYNQAGTLLRTVTGLITTSYVYTNVNESADNGGSLANALTFILCATRDGLTSYHAQSRGVSRTGATPSNPAYSPSGTWVQPPTGNATSIGGTTVTGTPTGTNNVPTYDPTTGTITWQPGGAITVREVDTSPSIAPTTIIEFPNNSLTNPSAGVARYTPTTFLASGTGHAGGDVPDPGAVAGTAKYLREDATFQVPPDTTYTDFVGAGGSHAHGLVPDPGATAGLNRYLSDDGTFKTFPASMAGIVAVRANTAGGVQSVVTSPTNVNLQCELVDYDTHGSHPTATSTDKERLVCKVAGFYYIYATVSFDTNTMNRRWIAIRKNGTTFYPAADNNGVSGDWTDLTVSTMIPLSVGDFIDFPLFQNSGSTLTIKDAQMGMYVVGAGPTFNYTGCRVTRVTDQSITASTNTVIGFTGEDWDTSGFHDNSTNNSRMTVPVTGKYRIWARMPFDNNSTGTIRILAITKNGGNLSTGVDVLAQHRHNPMTSDLTYLFVDVTEQLNAGDYVEVVVFQNTSGALSIKYFLGIHVRAGMELIGVTPQAQLINQDCAPINTPAENDEFENSILDPKWTVVTNTVAAVDINTTFKSILLAKFTGNQQYKIRQSYTPGSADFSINVKLHCAPSADFNSIGLYIGDSTDNNLVQSFISNQASAGGLTVGVHKTVSGSQTNNIGVKVFDAGSISKVYLHVQRASGNYSVWYSLDGVAYYSLLSGYTPGATLTVARLTIDFGMFGATNHIQTGIDWIRRDWFTIL